MKKSFLASLALLSSLTLLSEDSESLEILYEKLETLEQEIRDLRNLLEENSILVDRSLELQQQRYLDLDSRILELSKKTSEEEIKESNSPETQDPERELFREALVLFDEARYAEALEIFSKIIISFPEGLFTPDAYFWSGELFLAQDMYEDAKISFSNVVDRFPNHVRAADSLFKLGEISRLDEDLLGAVAIYKKVQDIYPSSGAAQLAKKSEENLKQ